MAKKKEPTVEKKLRALYDLQLIDSRIDEIVSLRGELPLEDTGARRVLARRRARCDGLVDELVVAPEVNF